jgi:hypothetical protein
MQASEQLLEIAGGAWDASLNHYDAGGGFLVTTQQIDEWVYVVGQDGYAISKHALAEWVGEDEQTAEPPIVDCDDAAMAWGVLRALRGDCMLWQCGACDAWIFTSNRPRVGLLRCSTCRTGGIDFRHADRHVGDDDKSSH